MFRDDRDDARGSGRDGGGDDDDDGDGDDGDDDGEDHTAVRLTSPGKRGRGPSSLGVSHDVFLFGLGKPRSRQMPASAFGAVGRSRTCAAFPLGVCGGEETKH